MALFSREQEKGPKVLVRGPDSTNPRAETPALPSELVAPSAILRPKSASVAEDSAFLGRGSKVSGKVAFNGSAQVDGEVEGEITVTHILDIKETATINAQIRAEAVVVAGKVHGDITCSHSIELRPSAVVIGNLSAPRMAIQEGARFEGHCSMPGAVREGEKVTVLPKQESAAPLAQANGQKAAPATISK